MKYSVIIILLLGIGLFFGFNAIKEKTNDEVRTNEYKQNSFSKKYTIESLNKLHNTNYFLHSAIEHIFIGSCGLDGNSEGLHYDNIKGVSCGYIKGSNTPPNEYGVYKAKAIIDGHIKIDDDGYSTFFPNSMSPQDIINSINQAYNTKHHVDGNIYIGRTKKGMEIEMYLTDKFKIISAFPKY